MLGANVGVRVGVAVGDWQNVLPLVTAAPLLSVISSSKVPKSPLVLMLVDCPAVSWKVLVETGVPLSNNVQLNATVILPPLFVIVKVPCASGVQDAETTMLGADVGVCAWTVEIVCRSVIIPSARNKAANKDTIFLLIMHLPTNYF